MTEDFAGYGYAPGHYFVICYSCLKQFDGDKRAIRCKACAEALHKTATKQYELELEEECKKN